MRKIPLGAALALMGITAAITVSITYVYAMNSFNDKVADVNARQAMYAKLSEIDQKVRQDTITEIDEAKLRDGICAGYVAGLGDNQAKYLSAEKYKDYLNKENGKSVGAGLETAQDEDGNMLVVEVLPGSPAESAGIKKGDTIVSVDGKEVVRITYGEALLKLDGEEGSEVKFSVLRKGEGAESEKLELSVLRAEYTKRSVAYTLLNGNIGYIQISAFSSITASQFNEAVKSLGNQGAAGLIIDLRDNSGGDMEAMADALDTLLPSGDTVVCRDKTGKKTVLYSSKPNEVALPVSVLVNGNTYGAAEVFAANIKDYKKGLLVGSKTAGYGTRSEVYPLSDGSAVIVSVADYLRLDSTSFTGKGIQPDVLKDLDSLQEALLAKKALTPVNDPQLQAAITALARQGAQVQPLLGATSSQPASSTAQSGSSSEQPSQPQESGSGVE